MLNIKNIIKKFHDKTILDDVSLSVDKGKIAVLLGASGVGKSTLLRVLAHLETIDKGSISLDGQPLKPEKHKVSMVFQNFNLFEHVTALENITLALTNVLGMKKSKAEKIAYELLEKYGIEDEAHKYPAQLSGGQKQRLALARSLAINPNIICLDEPTSALDPMLTSYVAKYIHELANKGLIVLVATHDTTLLERLDCMIYLMEAGKIKEIAPSKEFFANRQKYPAINTFVTGSID